MTSISAGTQEGTVPAPIPQPRRFNFVCPRCESVLEAHSGQCNRPGRCPSCATEFLIPEFDPETGVVGEPQDVSGQQQDPTPVHAYAAAGARAPEIVPSDSGDRAIRCPRCEGLSAIDANRCETCGLAFTMEGISYDAVPGSRNGYAVASLIMGVLGLPCSVLVVPQVLAVAFGTVALFQTRRATLARGQGFAIIGIALGVLSLALTTAAFVVRQ